MGHWLVLEVVLEPGQSADDGARVAREMMLALGIREDDLESGAYIDLLAPPANDG